MSLWQGQIQLYFYLFTHDAGTKVVNCTQIAVVLCINCSPCLQFIPNFIRMAGVVTVLWSEHLQNYSNPSRYKRLVSSPDQPGDLRSYPLSHSLDKRGLFLRVKCLGTTPWHLVLKLRMSGGIIHFCICPVTAEKHVLSQASPCGAYGGQSGTGTGFCHSTSVYSCQYHATIAPYSSTH